MTVIETPSLFSVSQAGRARKGDMKTARDAARRSNVGGLRAQIVELLRVKPLTDRELAVQLLPSQPHRWPSVVSARSGLRHDGLVVPTGDVRDGRAVWRLAGARDTWRIEQVKTIAGVL